VSTWVTRWVKGEPRDLKVVGDEPIAVATWRAPRRPLMKDACANCGAPRHYGSGPVQQDFDGPLICSGCSLTDLQDRELHVRYALKHGSGDFLEAARTAEREGRKVMAVKLATAGFHFGEEQLEARKLRAYLLREIGLEDLADEEDASLETAPIEADDASRKRGDHVVGPKIECAQLRLANNDPIGAGNAALEALEDELQRDQALEILLLVAGHLTEQDPEEVVNLINAASPYSHHSSKLCFALARAEYARNKLSACRRWLLHTRRLAPTHREALEMLDTVEEMMNVASTTKLFPF